MFPRMGRTLMSPAAGFACARTSTSLTREQARQNCNGECEQRTPSGSSATTRCGAAAPPAGAVLPRRSPAVHSLGCRFF